MDNTVITAKKQCFPTDIIRAYQGANASAVVIIISTTLSQYATEGWNSDLIIPTVLVTKDAESTLRNNSNAIIELIPTSSNGTLLRISNSPAIRGQEYFIAVLVIYGNFTISIFAIVAGITFIYLVWRLILRWKRNLLSKYWFLDAILFFVMLASLARCIIANDPQGFKGNLSQVGRIVLDRFGDAFLISVYSILAVLW